MERAKSKDKEMGKNKRKRNGAAKRMQNITEENITIE